MAAGQDRTEAPTAKRRLQARADGQAPVSREFVAWAALSAATLTLATVGAAAGATFTSRLRPLLEMSLTPREAATGAAWASASMLAPLLAAVTLAGGAAVLSQSGFLLRGAALKPDFARINPGRGLKRLFAVDNLVNAIKAVAKVSVLAWATGRAILDSLAGLAAASSTAPQVLAAEVLSTVLRLVLPVLGAQALIAGLDVLWMRVRHTRALRMSREEVKQENRDTDGDPRVKARVRQIRMARARGRMMQAVPKATVVVTNPTHFAVALVFDRAAQAAPRVVAKGADEVAARIRALAQAHGVPLVANPPLARALFRSELEAEIPAEHFQAVAEIIAYVWRLKAPRPMTPRPA